MLSHMTKNKGHVRKKLSFQSAFSNANYYSKLFFFLSNIASFFKEPAYCSP